jgi:hypothetical protein
LEIMFIRFHLKVNTLVQIIINFFVGHHAPREG